jgi:hypothetical protein
MSTSIFREAFFGVIQMRINSIFRKYPEGWLMRNAEVQLRNKIPWCNIILSKEIIPQSAFRIPK